MYGLECGHRFCTQCWSEYLTTKIMEEGMGQTIACAAHDCPILVDDATVMKLVGDPKVKLKYQHLITNSFVQVKVTTHTTHKYGKCKGGFQSELSISPIPVQSFDALVPISWLYECHPRPMGWLETCYVCLWICLLLPMWSGLVSIKIIINCHASLSLAFPRFIIRNYYENELRWITVHWNSFVGWASH